MKIVEKNRSNNGEVIEGLLIPYTGIDAPCFKRIKDVIGPPKVARVLLTKEEADKAFQEGY